MGEVKEKLRIDKYLWAIRLFKTRSQAADACDKGRVKYQGNAAKASRIVTIGDEYEVKTEAKKLLIKVTGLLHNRVAFTEAIKYYIDLTPEEELDKNIFYRANRKYIINANYIKRFKPLERSKISVELTLPVNEEIIISQENSANFKKWIAQS